MPSTSFLKLEKTQRRTLLRGRRSDRWNRISVRRQCHRSNVNTSNPENYYRCVFISFLDHIYLYSRAGSVTKTEDQMLSLRELLKKTHVDATRSDKAIFGWPLSEISRASRDRSLDAPFRGTCNCWFFKGEAFSKHLPGSNVSVKRSFNTLKRLKLACVTPRARNVWMRSLLWPFMTTSTWFWPDSRSRIVISN